MQSWYIAKINVQKETVLETFLSNYGVGAFSPKIIYLGQKGGTPKPLFPTYMFFDVDPESSTWPIVRWAPGIMYFLPRDGYPAPIPQALIDFLRQRTTQWNDSSNSSRLRQGDKVVVTGGPFDKLEGVFQSYIPSKDRCRILLDVVGQLTRVEISGSEVKGIPSASFKS